MEWYYKLLIALTCLIAIILLIVWFLIKPGNAKKCYKYDWMYKNPIAHILKLFDQKAIIRPSAFWISCYKCRYEQPHQFCFSKFQL